MELHAQAAACTLWAVVAPVAPLRAALLRRVAEGCGGCVPGSAAAVARRRALGGGRRQPGPGGGCVPGSAAAVARRRALGIMYILVYWIHILVYITDIACTSCFQGFVALFGHPHRPFVA